MRLTPPMAYIKLLYFWMRRVRDDDDDDREIRGARTGEHLLLTFCYKLKFENSKHIGHAQNKLVAKYKSISFGSSLFPRN